jgi:hypothetical protein
MTNSISRKSTQHTDTTDLAPLTIIRTETVLSRLPIHNLSKKAVKLNPPCE